MKPLSCSVKHFCLGGVLIFAGTILLTALGFSIVLPHEATREWRKVTCNVTNATYDVLHCPCDQHVDENQNEDCSKYPCLKVFVNYIDHEINSISSTDEEFSVEGVMLSSSDDLGSFKTTVYKNDSQGDSKEKWNGSFNVIRTSAIPQIKEGRLYRYWNDAFYETCSLIECGDEAWNVAESERFRKGWGEAGTAFDCYNDPTNPEKLVLERTSRLAMIHAIAWPAVCLVLGSIIWLGLCFGCWRIETEESIAAQQNSSRTPSRSPPGTIL